jgi:hypothetical protein
MKSDSWIILEVGGALLLLSMMCFFFTPAYEKGLWLVISALVVQLGNLLGAKYGSKMPEQSTDAKPGQSSIVDSKITNVPDPPAADPA